MRRLANPETLWFTYIKYMTLCHARWRNELVPTPTWDSLRILLERPQCPEFRGCQQMHTSSRIRLSWRGPVVSDFVGCLTNVYVFKNQTFKERTHGLQIQRHSNKYIRLQESDFQGEDWMLYTLVLVNSSQPSLLKLLKSKKPNVSGRC